MERNYTKAVRQGFFDMIENDTADIWKGLDRSAELINSGKWKEHYEDIVSKYRISSRYAIMRVLFEEVTSISHAEIDADMLRKGFSVEGIGTFPDISIEHAENMGADEVACYEQLLLRRVEESDPCWLGEARGLIKRAFALSDLGAKSELCRDEIIRLGHMINISMEHMQFILLRVLGDNEAGFNHSKSMDLIDIFGFVNRSTLSEVDELKTWYMQNVGNNPKVDYAEKSVHFTQDIAFSIKKVFSHWSSEDRVEELKAWLIQQAPYLDVKSKTARKVYVNLAAYAFCRTAETMHYIGAGSEKKLLNPDLSRHMHDIMSDDLYSDMLCLSRLKDYHAYAVEKLFDRSNRRPDLKKCKYVAHKLIYENAEYATDFAVHSRNSEKLYHVPYVEKKEVTARGSLNANSKKRIVDILMDKAAPTKSDLLYLLWFIVNNHWLGEDVVEEKSEFLQEFLNSAACLLDAALLPEFYPPNILEETMMLSIVLASEEYMPAMVYEAACKSISRSPEPKPHPKDGKLEKSQEKKREIVEYYFSLLEENHMKEVSKKACAEHFGVAKSSVENYIDQYIVQYYLDHLAEFTSETSCKEACAEHFGLTVISFESKYRRFPNGLAKNKAKNEELG